MKLKDSLQAFVALTVIVCTVTADAIADIPAPKTETNGTDWSFILMGGISAFLGALLFIWLGRRLFKKT